MRRVDPAGGGERPRAPDATGAFIISCVSDAPFTNYHVNRGATRDLSDWSERGWVRETTRVASFPISLKERREEKERGRR